MMGRLFSIALGALLVLHCVALPIPSEDAIDPQVTVTELSTVEQSIPSEYNSATTQTNSLSVTEVVSPETATETIESKSIDSTLATESSNENLSTPQSDSSVLELSTSSLPLDLLKEQPTELVESTETASVQVKSNEQQISDASETASISVEHEPQTVSDSSEPNISPAENGIPESPVTEAVESEQFATTIASEIVSESNVTEIAITQSIELDSSLAPSSEDKPAALLELSITTEEPQSQSVEAETKESLESVQSDKPETTLSQIAPEVPESPTLEQAAPSNEGMNAQSSDSSVTEAAQTDISDPSVASTPAPEQPEALTLAPLEQVALSDEPKPSDSISKEVAEPETVLSQEITTIATQSAATEPQHPSVTTLSPESESESEVTEPLQTQDSLLNEQSEPVVSEVSNIVPDQTESSTLSPLQQVALSDEPSDKPSDSNANEVEVVKPENIQSPDIQTTETESVEPEPQSPSVTTLSSAAESEPIVTEEFLESRTPDLQVTQQPEPEPSTALPSSPETTLPSESQSEETSLTESTSVPQVSNVQLETESIVEPHSETISEASSEGPQESIVSSTDPVLPIESSNSDSNIAEITQTQHPITSNADEAVAETVNSEQQTPIASTLASATESEPESPNVPETLSIENTITAQPEISDSPVYQKAEPEPESSSQEVSPPTEPKLEEPTVLTSELSIIEPNINQQQKESQISTTQTIIESQTLSVPETVPLSSIDLTEEEPQPQSQTESNDLAEQKAEPTPQTEEPPTEEVALEAQDTLTEQLKPLEDEAKAAAVETPTLQVVNDNSVVQLPTVASVESNDSQVAPVTTSESKFLMVEVPRELVVIPEVNSNQLALHQTLQELSSSTDNLDSSTSDSTGQETVTHETELIEPTTQIPTPESLTSPVTKPESPNETIQTAISDTARPVPTSTAVVQSPVISANSSAPERKVFISSISRQIRTFKPPVKDQIANTTLTNTLSSASIVQARSGASSRAISLILATILTMLYYVISQ